MSSQALRFALSLLLFSSIVRSLPKNQSTTGPSILGTSPVTLPASEGCLWSFTGPNSDIPMPETGFTVISSNTIPCDLFLSVAHSYSESEVSLRQHSTSQPSSVLSLTCGENCPIDNHDWILPTAPAGYTNALYPPAPSAFLQASSVYEQNRVSCSGRYSSHASRVIFSSTLRGFTYANITNEVPATTDIEMYTTMVLTSSIKPPAGCCGPCVITADAVQLLYWPPESHTGNASITEAPSIPHSYVSNGVTFISPSVYVAYQNLAASRQCAPFEDDALAVYNTTVAYAPDALSTKHCFNGGPAPQIWKQMNYTMFLHPPPNSLVSDCHFFAGLDLNPASHDVAASPWFSFPSDITTVDPAFQGCSIWWNGAWDPPRTLVPESAMVASSLDFDPSPTSKAKPGAQVTPTLAPATATGPKVGPSESPFADPKESSTASAVEQDPQRVDPEKTTEPLDPPTESKDSPGTAPLPPSSPETGATSAAVPAAGPVALQPSNHNLWQSSEPPSGPSATAPVASHPSNGKPWDLSDPPKEPPVEAAETSGPAVLVALPKASNPHDPQKVGAPSSEVISSTYASSPGSGSGVPPAVGYIPVSIPGNPIAKAPNGGINFADSSIAVGSQATIYGHVVSAGSSGVVVDSNTYGLPTPAAPLQTLILDPNAQGSGGGTVLASITALPFTWASNGDVVIASSTIAVGNQAAIDGHVFSIGTSAVVVDGSTYTPPSPAAQISAQTLLQIPTPVLISGNLISTGPSGDIVVASSTIAIGNQATVYGHVVSAGSSNVVVDGNTYARSFSAGSESKQTGRAGDDLASTVVGGISSSSVGIGGLIMSGFGDGPSPTSAGSGSNIPASIGSVAIGSSTPNTDNNMANGAGSPTFTGSSWKGGIDVRLLSLAVMSSAAGIAWAFS